jgi:hypothetical protein
VLLFTGYCFHNYSKAIIHLCCEVYDMHIVKKKGMQNSLRKSEQEESLGDNW